MDLNVGHFDAMVFHGFIVGLWEPLRLASEPLRGPQWLLVAPMLSDVMLWAHLVCFLPYT